MQDTVRGARRGREDRRRSTRYSCQVKSSKADCNTTCIHDEARRGAHADGARVSPYTSMYMRIYQPCMGPSMGAECRARRCVTLTDQRCPPVLGCNGYITFLEQNCHLLSKLTKFGVPSPVVTRFGVPLHQSTCLGELYIFGFFMKK